MDTNLARLETKRRGDGLLVTRLELRAAIDVDAAVLSLHQHGIERFHRRMREVGKDVFRLERLRCLADGVLHVPFVGDVLAVVLCRLLVFGDDRCRGARLGGGKVPRDL
jgi:hypothetical protein